MQRTDGQSILPCALGSGEKLQAGFPANGAALVQVHQSVETHATRGHHAQRCARGAPCRMPYAHTARAPASATPHSTCASCMLVRQQADSIYHGTGHGPSTVLGWQAWHLNAKSISQVLTPH